MKRLHRKNYLAYAIILTGLMMVTTGCWDMIEPNQRSVWVGTGLDLSPEGNLLLSAQIAVPKAAGEAGGGGGGGTDDTYFVKTAIGKNLEDSFQRIQAKLSRKVFLGHRDVIFIGEQLGKQGFKKFLDEFGRNPISNIRANLFFIKYRSAQNFLMEKAELEQFSSVEAIRQVHFNGIRDRMTTMVYFKEVMQRDGMRPILQVIGPKDGAGQNKKMETKGSLSATREIALFNKSLQVVGFLQEEEAVSVLWASGYLDTQMITEYLSKANGLATVDLHHIKRQIDSTINGKKIHIKLVLMGKGMLDENDTNLDLFNNRDIRALEKEFNEKVSQRVVNVIKMVQKDFGTDVFGFGEALHRKYPDQWKHMKEDWDKLFPEVEVTVTSQLAIRHIGERGPK
ncbi:Ger(x)C family spore germination protein [Paenibacillus cremeus]|nr:Ger(x)C family spore germination protein [Paenibacillus cremeus]